MTLARPETMAARASRERRVCVFPKKDVIVLLQLLAHLLSEYLCGSSSADKVAVVLPLKVSTLKWEGDGSTSLSV